ncbi:MAG: metallophosphoesterase [Pseudomonadota bacterium]
MKAMNRRQFIKFGGASLAGLTLSGLNIPIFAPRRAFAMLSDTTWKFGVMADTQWQTKSGAVDPASCATTIIDALNGQFIQHGCKFVIQVGDLVDTEVVSGIRTLPTREAHTTDLYNAGIGFFPVRGNHESSADAAREMVGLFPQTRGQGPSLFGATNFNGPVIGASATYPNGVLNGLSYMFDYENLRCVLIDQFVRADKSNVASSEGSYNANAVDQVPWVDSVLSSNANDRHAFVFSHKNLIGQNHKDNLFGKKLTSNAAARDEFLYTLHNNGVRYHLSGHDHMHHHSIVRSSDHLSGVGQIICASNSYKFYIPQHGDDGRETPLDQELFSIGYYIVTIDGPRATIDFYSSSHGQDYGDFDLIAPPSSFAFYLRDSFGYSLNGNQFEIAQGESYTKVQDTCDGTEVRILSGVNGNTETDQLNRALSKAVNTGWSDSFAVDGAASKVLSLWGMADNLSLYDGNLTGLLPNTAESTQGDIYSLSLTYDPKKIRPSQIMSGKLGLATKAGTHWVNAVDMNTGGSKIFKYGPWRESYALGTWGVDPSARTVWAVVNHDGDFVAKLM